MHFFIYKQVTFKKRSLQKYSQKAASTQNFIKFLYDEKLIYVWYVFSRTCAYIIRGKQKNYYD